MPGFQPYTIPAKKPFYHIVMKQISFFVKSGLLLVAFMTFSGYGKAQISIENSADDKVEIKKLHLKPMEVQTFTFLRILVATIMTHPLMHKLNTIKLSLDKGSFFMLEQSVSNLSNRIS